MKKLEEMGLVLDFIFVKMTIDLGSGAEVRG